MWARCAGRWLPGGLPGRTLGSGVRKFQLLEAQMVHPLAHDQQRGGKLRGWCEERDGSGVAFGLGGQLLKVALNLLTRQRSRALADSGQRR